MMYCKSRCLNRCCKSYGKDLTNKLKYVRVYIINILKSLENCITKALSKYIENEIVKLLNFKIFNLQNIT